MDFLDQQTAEKQFFLLVSYSGSEASPEMYAKTNFESLGWEPLAANATEGKEYFKNIVVSIRKTAASLTALDGQIPDLISKLDKRGLRDNTLIVFTSPSGCLLGRHGLWGDGQASNPPNMYEEVVATPMIWNWPGRIPVEGVRPELVSAYDVVPSLCEVAGIPAPPNLCGRSYLNLVLNKPMTKKHPWQNLVFGDFQNTQMARDKRYKLVSRDGGKGPGEFYDLSADPREKVNQYANPRYNSMRDLLAAELAAWLKRYA